MISYFQNKAVKPSESEQIQGRIDGLRLDEIRLEGELRAARGELGTSEVAIGNAEEMLIAGKDSRRTLESAQAAQRDAQAKVAAITEQLGQTRQLLVRARGMHEAARSRDTAALRADLEVRYNAARFKLCETLVAAAQANAVVEALELEASELFPLGSRPEIPPAFRGFARSFPGLSLRGRDRVKHWLVSLQTEAPAAVSPAGITVIEEMASEDAQAAEAAAKKVAKFEANLQALQKEHRRKNPPMYTHRPDSERFASHPASR